MRPVFIVSIAAAAALTLAAIAPALSAGEHHWMADPVHSSAEFTIKHFGFFNVKGTIPIQQATITTQGDSALPTSIMATLDPNGIDTKAGDRDSDLRSDHFFDVARFPQITFSSTKVSTLPDGTFTVDGMLTIHGVTKPVTLTASYVGAMTDQRGRKHAGYSATTQIKRSDFGMTYGPILAGDDVTISLEIEAIQQS
jgi:polyisoprenoid-binding protein YceI